MSRYANFESSPLKDNRVAWSARLFEGDHVELRAIRGPLHDCRGSLRRHGPSRERGSRAFTLVELLTVIAIIGLLASLIMPSLGAARVMAREAQTKSLLHVLETGLQQYRDEKLAHDAFPPGRVNVPTTPDPYGEAGNYTAYGAETLYWAVTGADGLGTPGFIPDTSLSNDTDGLYHLTSGQPDVRRAGPYVEPNNKNVARVPVPKESGTPRTATVFIDAFDKPVLYFRADTFQAGTGIYSLNDEVDDASSPSEGFLVYETASGVDPYPLAQGHSGDTPPGWPSGSPSSNFEQYTWNPKVPGTYRPNNADSFLLVAAGSDEIYGRNGEQCDDLTNFPLVGLNYQNTFTNP
jgi:prepilin-type N-terminal cleavage/methylation domain-containing protein